MSGDYGPDSGPPTLTTVVTGANGFLASHIVRILLERGHKVHGTVRDPESSGCAHLKTLPGAERLRLFKADLLDPAAFDSALADADAVIHTASPVASGGGGGDPEKELIQPAVAGTLNVLRAAAAAAPRLRSVVVTSSTYATDPTPLPSTITEQIWSDAQQQQAAGEWYGSSKTIAEKAAYEYIFSLPEAQRPRLATILPAGIMGPSLSRGPLGSYVGYMLQLVKTGMDEIPDDYMAFVDVRDCASHHVAALEGGREGRFFSVGGSWHCKDVVAAFKAAHPGMLGVTDFKGVPITPANYDPRRMQSLGVSVRSMDQIIKELVESWKDRGDLES